MQCVPIFHLQNMISINLTRRMRSHVLHAILSVCSQAKCQGSNDSVAESLRMVDFLFINLFSNCKVFYFVQYILFVVLKNSLCNESIGL